MVLKIGKIYKDRSGRLIKIIKGNPPILTESGLQKDGWNGIYWGESIDDEEPKIDNERYEFNGNHWDYWSMFSGFRTGKDDNSFNVPEKDLIEETQYE